jgi:hypothetical protein
MNLLTVPAKRKASIDEVHQIVSKAIKASKSARPGTRTNAQFYQDLVLERRIENAVGDSFPFPPSCKVWVDAWFTDAEPTFPGEDTNESGDNGTQAFFDGQMQNIIQTSKANNGELPVRQAYKSDPTKFIRKVSSKEPLTSVPVLDVHNTPAFLRRKFDGYTTQLGRAGPLSIIFPTELKGALPRHRGFPDEQVGQILDMVTQLMEFEQRSRLFMYSGLTDGYRWQFFKIIRTERSYQYQQSTIYNGLAGWRHFLGIICSPLPDLGAATPDVTMNGLETISLECVLGVGNSSVVYRSKISYNGDAEEDALVKVYHDQLLTSRQAECTALVRLLDAGVQGVPRVVLGGLGVSAYPGSSIVKENILVLQPVGHPVLPVKGGRSIQGDHLIQLIFILKHAHQSGLQHRDVKPDNIYLVGESLILNDWGSACGLKEEEPWQGTPGFCDPPSFEGGGVARDLRSAVRAAWAMCRNQFPDHEDPCFWDFLEQEDRASVWVNAWTQANNKNYTELALSLSFAM